MKINRSRLLAKLLTVVFICSFLPYVTVAARQLLILAPSLLVLLAFVITPIIFPKRVGLGLNALARSRVLVFAVIMPLAPSLIAFITGNGSSILYALLMSAVLISIRLIMNVTSLSLALDAFASAGAICVPWFTATYFGQISESIVSGSRLIPETAQPNAVAFMFVGFFITSLWICIQPKIMLMRKLLHLVIVVMTAIVMYATSSRASMLAASMALVWLIYCYLIRALKAGRVPRIIAVGFLIAAVVVTGLVVVSDGKIIDALVSSVEKALKLNSSYRGLNSGLSGRTERWSVTVRAIASGFTWIFGAGYRSSGDELGFSIDNGYLTVWYECGLLGLMAVVGQLIWLMKRYRVAFERKINEVQGQLNALLIPVLIVALLVNNFFDRYLFGLGNPFSLLALFFLLAGRTDVAVSGRLLSCIKEANNGYYASESEAVVCG